MLPSKCRKALTHKALRGVGCSGAEEQRSGGTCFGMLEKSNLDSSAVRVAVRMVLFGTKIQQGRQQCGADCCQKGFPEGENTAGQTAVRCGLLSGRLPGGQKYSSIYSIAVRPAVSTRTKSRQRPNTGTLFPTTAGLNSRARIVLYIRNCQPLTQQGK